MKVTVIGLGAMGAGMTGNLFRAGHLKLAWNRSAERAQAAAAAHGFAIADSLEAAAGQADLVITSVSADGDLREVVDRLAQVMTAGSVVLDTSTVSIETAREVAARDFRDVEVFELGNYYPAGDEQVLVNEVTGRVVPEGGIPLQVGTVVNKTVKRNPTPPFITSKLQQEAIRRLRHYHWPGNLIQLQNVIERALALGVDELIQPEDLPAEIETFSRISKMT